MLKELLALPSQCVLIVVDGSRAWVGCSTSPVQTIAKLVGELGSRATNPVLVVRSANSDIETLKLHCQYYRDYYHRKLGLAPIVDYGRKAIQYKVRTVPSLSNTRIDVELVTARGDSSIVVGRFRKIGEARDFIETYYGTDNPVKLPVYAWNSDTKEFLLDKQTKTLRVYK